LTAYLAPMIAQFEVFAPSCIPLRRKDIAHVSFCRR
jgi:hypothetical protein